MDILEQLEKKLLRQLEIYESLLVESGGRCNTNAFMEKYISIALECIKLTGKSDYIVNVIDEAIIKYSAESFKIWKYYDMMLQYLKTIKDNILALQA